MNLIWWEVSPIANCYFSILLVLILLAIGCQDECYEDDSRNVRVDFSIESPSLPDKSNINLVCGILENPAELLEDNQGNVSSVFLCPEAWEFSGGRWVLELEMNGQCADGKRYKEVFRPDYNNSAQCTLGEEGRSMPIGSLENGNRLSMCPDFHRPNNYGSADYYASLYLRTPLFSSTGNPEAGGCSNCPWGYYVHIRADMFFIGLGFTESIACSDLPSRMELPFNSIPECEY